MKENNEPSKLPVWAGIIFAFVCSMVIGVVNIMMIAHLAIDPWVKRSCITSICVVMIAFIGFLVCMAISLKKEK